MRHLVQLMILLAVKLGVHLIPAGRNLVFPVLYHPSCLLIGKLDFFENRFPSFEKELVANSFSYIL